jgi:energy-coupling factor transporter transmembrane protein EcfT
MASLTILITIMVLELKIPHTANWAALPPVLPVFLVYALSFVFLGIYWNNHHHMFHLVDQVNESILWANMNLLFWLSAGTVRHRLDGRELLRSTADSGVRRRPFVIGIRLHHSPEHDHRPSGSGLQA